MLGLHQSEDDALWMKGLLRYQSCGYVRPSHKHNIIWQKNQVQCYALHSEHNNAKPTMLWIPSLINRYYILDINHELSLLRFLAQSGMNIYVIDWHHPHAEQAYYDSGYYIAQYIMPLVKKLSAAAPIHLAGYCAGGLLALATVCHYQVHFASLSLLATPWDFSQMQDVVQHPLCRGAIQHALQTRSPLLHGAYINWLFYLMNPQTFKDKYANFATIEEKTQDYMRFVMVEHWVNDAVALTQAFAKECLLDWAQHNNTMKGMWHVRDAIINPATIACPTFIAAPKRDQIVPPNSVRPLADIIPHTHYITPDAGHVGMIVGKNRHHALWHPLRDFVRSCASQQNRVCCAL